MRYEFVTPTEAELMLKALECIQTICEETCLGSQIPVERHPDDCKWCLIYRLAHAGTSPSCKASHPDWESQIEGLHKVLSNG